MRVTQFKPAFRIGGFVSLTDEDIITTRTPAWQPVAMADADQSDADADQADAGADKSDADKSGADADQSDSDADQSDS